MSPDEQKSFILVKNAEFVVRFTQLLETNQIPLEWDEPELLLYMAEYFRQKTIGDKRMNLKRQLAYDASLRKYKL